MEAELLFTGTDSLSYEIKSEYVSEEFYKDRHLIDLSNYRKDSTFFDSVNEKVIGKMKVMYKEEPIRIVFFQITVKNLIQQNK